MRTERSGEKGLAGLNHELTAANLSNEGLIDEAGDRTHLAFGDFGLEQPSSIGCAVW